MDPSGQRTMKWPESPVASVNYHFLQFHKFVKVMFVFFFEEGIVKQCCSQQFCKMLGGFPIGKAEFGPKLESAL